MQDIFEVLRQSGFDTVPETFYRDIELWNSWYMGNVKNFHTFRVFNGQRKVQCHRYSMGMANKVATDWANLLMNEKVKITLEGEKEQAFFDKVSKENNFLVMANQMQEMKIALGTTAYVPMIYGATADEETGELSAQGGRIKIEYVIAGNIYPLSWDYSGVTECAFCSDKVIDTRKYKYVQIHMIQGDEYVVQNRIFDATNGSLTEVELSNVKGFESVVPVIHTGSLKRLFVIDKPNIVNNTDINNPMGISVYANAIDNLKACDVAFDSYVNEFLLGKKRIIVQPEMLRDFDTDEPYFDLNDLTFYAMANGAGDTTNGIPIHEIDMKLRTSEHNTGIQDMLNALSAKVGFGEAHYKFDGGSVATATQVVSENSEMFRTIKKHEIILESVLDEIVRIILRLGNMLGEGLDEEVEVSIDFDDSIIEDKTSEFNRDMQMLSAGILNPYEFRMKWMNEDEQTAKEALPTVDSLVNDVV